MKFKNIKVNISFDNGVITEVKEIKILNNEKAEATCIYYDELEQKKFEIKIIYDIISNSKDSLLLDLEEVLKNGFGYETNW